MLAKTLPLSDPLREGREAPASPPRLARYVTHSVESPLKVFCVALKNPVKSRLFKVISL